jgi:hypothetical protein
VLGARCPLELNRIRAEDERMRGVAVLVGAGRPANEAGDSEA